MRVQKRVFVERAILGADQKERVLWGREWYPGSSLLPDFIRWGPGYSRCIMGLPTQDPYIQKEHTELYKILKFRVNCANIEQDTANQKLKNLVTNDWIAGHLSANLYILRTLVRPGNPYISLQILKILNGCILFNIGPINTKLKDFVKLGVLFLNI